MPQLGVNIDHVATLRQARRGSEPDVLEAAGMALKSGADSIVAHLREDRRHIQDEDVWSLRRLIKKRFNLEMSLSPEIIKIALAVKPDQVTLVPEKRQEITTEGGLDVKSNARKISQAFDKFSSKNIIVSLFIDPDKRQISYAHQLGIKMIELHTGTYALKKTKAERVKELKKLDHMTQYAHELGIIVNAGHGLNYMNTRAVAAIKHMEELNIGHSVISRSISDGLATAVRDMKRLVR